MPFKSFAFAVTAASQRELFQAPRVPGALRQPAVFMRAPPIVASAAADPELHPGWTGPKYEGWTEPPHPGWIEHPYPSGSLRGDRNTAPAPGSAGAPENAGPSSSWLGHGAVATAAVGAAAEPEQPLQGWTEPQYERSEPQYEGWVEPTHPDWLEHSYPYGSLRGGRNTAPGTESAGSADVAMLAIAGAVVGAVIGYATKKQGA